MDECVAATLAQGIHGQFGGGPLRPFFFRLAKLLRVPANFVFVFDGPERPARERKRGKSVSRHQQLWWVAPSQELIQHFGFTVHEVSTFIDLLDLNYAELSGWRLPEKPRLNLPC
jgi:hypothetical protein